MRQADWHNKHRVIFTLDSSHRVISDSLLLRCSTARGPSISLSRVSPTKVKGRKYFFSLLPLSDTLSPSLKCDNKNQPSVLNFQYKRTFSE